ncbi:MAG: polysaccharide deacetylase family protein [Nitrospira sp.]|nr:polysaccharide deacetylase family protein [Nitrospira sp.]
MSAERIPVLMYHRIGDAKNDWERKYCVSAECFEAQMKAMARAGWHAVPSADFCNWLAGGKPLPEKSFVLTFDDGFLSVHEHAAPVLRALKWPATVFLVSQLIGQRDIWCAAHNPSGETYPLMTMGHISELRGAGFTFHSHTRTHADLTTLDDDALQDQLTGSRTDLEALIGEPVPLLAYPYGRHDGRVVAAAERAGYRFAFSVQPGFNRRDVSAFRIRRLDVFGTDTPSMLLRKIQLGSNDGSLGAWARYCIIQILARLGIR